MKTETRHHGTVKSITGNVVEISIMNDRAGCKGCAISSICNINDEGTLSITTETPERYRQGQQVTVSPGSGGTWKAIIFLLLIPVLLFAVWISVKEATEISDTTMGIGVLFSLILYFTIIYFCRRPLHSAVHWQIND